MPEEGINYVKKSELLSYEEMRRLMSVLSEHGIRKVRITGGEPFLRKDIMELFRALHAMPKIEKIALTTNGTLTLPHLEELVALGIRSINLSIDSIDPARFAAITRRTSFNEVWDCYQAMLDAKIDLKLNCVVLKEHNIEDIIPMVALGKHDHVSVRFIEEMPFNGEGTQDPILEWNHVKILEHIKDHFPNIEKLEDPKSSTSFNYRVEGFKGSFGIIPAYTRSFCGSCNRLRITPNGTLKTCLYDDGIFNVRDLMRAGATDVELMTAIQEAIGHKTKDGFEAERNRTKGFAISESMSTIGG